MRLHLVRHGVTAHTDQRLFSGGLEGFNPPLTDAGRDQARGTASWLAGSVTPDLLVASPVQRARQTADELAAAFECDVVEDVRFAEMNFGDWEGRSFVDLFQSRDPDIQGWFGDIGYPAGRTGESFLDVQKRVLQARDDLLETHEGKTVVVVSHVTPIKVLVADAVGSSLESLFRFELEPTSVSTVRYDRHGTELHKVLQRFNALPPGRESTYR